MNYFALLYVAGGGAFGSVCRYLTVVGVSRLPGAANFPYGTLVVNILGSLLMGVWIGFMANMMPERAKDLHLLFAVGMLGGFTTFSAFSLDAISLLQSGNTTQALIYIVGSVTLSLAALMLGLALVRMVTA